MRSPSKRTRRTCHDRHAAHQTVYCWQPCLYSCRSSSLERSVRGRRLVITADFPRSIKNSSFSTFIPSPNFLTTWLAFTITTTTTTTTTTTKTIYKSAISRIKHESKRNNGGPCSMFVIQATSKICIYLLTYLTTWAVWTQKVYKVNYDVMQLMMQDLRYVDTVILLPLLSWLSHWFIDDYYPMSVYSKPDRYNSFFYQSSE